MSVIDDVKKLLATASPGPWQALATKKRREATLWAAEGRYSIATFHDQGHSDPLACAQLAALVHPLFQALVESQEALEAICVRHCGVRWREALDMDEQANALRLDGLAKVMKR